MTIDAKALPRIAAIACLFAAVVAASGYVPGLRMKADTIALIGILCALVGK